MFVRVRQWLLLVVCGGRVPCPRPFAWACMRRGARPSAWHNEIAPGEGGSYHVLECWKVAAGALCWCVR